MGDNMSGKILVVAAHPDDETLGAGATIVKHIEQKDEVSVLILGTGITSRGEEGNASSELAELRSDAKKALAKLGVEEVEFSDFPDNSFDSVPLLKIIKKVEETIGRLKPDTIYTHHWGDLNVDHRLTYEAVMTACRPFVTSVNKIACFEIPSSTECNTKDAESHFIPNMFIDVSGTIGRKLDALREYRGEMREYPHPRSIEGVEILAKKRGLTIASEAAEAFVVAREIKR